MDEDELHAELSELVEQAVRNEGAAPRKHHLIPTFYLRRWEADGLLRVTDVDQRHSFLTSAANAARETDFYSLESQDLDPSEVPPLLAETALSRLESAAAEALAVLLDDCGRLSSQQRFDLTALMLMQYTRGRLHREGQKYLTKEFHRATYGSLTRQAARETFVEYEGRAPTEEELDRLYSDFQALQRGDLVVHQQRPQMVLDAMQLAIDGGACLYDRVWTLMTCRRDLLTTDEPVLAVAFDAAPRDERTGLGIAPVVFFPLGPSKVLAMFHPVVAPSVGLKEGSQAELDGMESVALSHELLATSHRWAFEAPCDDNRSLALKLRVPARVESARFESVTGAIGPDGGELMRFYVPTRWASAATVPPSPVRGWFPHWMNLPALADLGEVQS